MNSAEMESQVRIAKVMSNPIRLAILDILRQRVASPNEVHKELGLGLSSVSHHFRLLKDGG